LTFRPDPLLSVPLFLRCIADFTLFDAALPYFAIIPPLRTLAAGDPRAIARVFTAAFLAVPQACSTPTVRAMFSGLAVLLVFASTAAAQATPRNVRVLVGLRFILD
jgi:hypothetical protein